MENKNVPSILSDKTTDLTTKELAKIEKYKEAGLPGISSFPYVQATKALDLYFAGKTYSEISQTLQIKKEIVTYLAHKFDWYASKMEHLEILDANMRDRILHAKLVNQDFVLQIQQFFLRKIGRKITRFMATNDDQVSKEIDGKDLDRYYKAVELLDKLTAERPSGSSKPAVGLNLGDGVTITKDSDGQVTITPKGKTTGEMLQELANLKRDQEKTSYDIKTQEDEQLKKEQDNEE